MTQERDEAEVKRCASRLMLLIAIGGCAGTPVVPVRNVERVTTVWQSDNGLIPHLCLEYASPAEKLQATKASLGVPIGEKNVEVSYESSESLATIYTVSEIMQFGHAALYRLCEAYGNKAVDKDKFNELFDSALKSVNGLIELQLSAKNGGAAVIGMRLQKDIQDLDKERCKLLKSTSAEREAKWKNAAAQRSELVDRYEKIKEVQDLLPSVPEDKVQALEGSAQKYIAALLVYEKGKKDDAAKSVLTAAIPPELVASFAKDCGMKLEAP